MEGDVDAEDVDASCVLSMGDGTHISILVNFVKNPILTVYNYIFLERLHYKEVTFGKIRWGNQDGKNSYRV